MESPHGVCAIVMTTFIGRALTCYYGVRPTDYPTNGGDRRGRTGGSVPDQVSDQSDRYGVSGEPRIVDYFPDVQAAIDLFADDPLKQRVMLLRLAMRLNNGDEHFDHGEHGYSWLCHRCAREGKGGLNGWVGALATIRAAAVQ